MIRINLLAVKKRKKKLKGPSNLLLFLVAANLAALLIAGGATFLIKVRVDRLKALSDANKAAIAQLNTKIKEIKNLEQLNKTLDERSKLIEMLRKNQSVPVRVLDDVNTLVPDGVWLASLTFKENGISIEGNAFSNINIVSFIDNLKKSPDLSDVYLEESREGEIDKVKVYKFKANFKVKV